MAGGVRVIDGAGEVTAGGAEIVTTVGGVGVLASVSTVIVGHELTGLVTEFVTVVEVVRVGIEAVEVVDEVAEVVV